MARDCAGDFEGEVSGAKRRYAEQTASGSSFPFYRDCYGGTLGAEAYAEALPAAMRLVRELCRRVGPDDIDDGIDLLAWGLSVAQRSEARRTLRAWLLSTDGGDLVVPGEPELTWHDAICTGVSDWTSLFADGQAVVTFECVDPIAYEADASFSDDSFTVGGMWETWPVIGLAAEERSSVNVGYSEIASSLVVQRAFVAGDAVSIDCLAQTVAVNGEDATADVTLGSDFFALRPDDVTLAFSGCPVHTISWTERWA